MTKNNALKWIEHNRASLSPTTDIDGNEGWVIQWGADKRYEYIGSLEIAVAFAICEDILQPTS